MKHEPADSTNYALLIPLVLTSIPAAIFTALYGHAAVFITVPLFAFILYGVEEIGLMTLWMSLIKEIKEPEPYLTPETTKFYERKADPALLGI